MYFNFLLLYLSYQLINHLECISSNNFVVQKDFYKLDLNKINQLYHLTSIKTILKGKAKSILRELPKEESIIYSLCLSDSKILNHLIKCVANVIKAKNRYNINNNAIKKWKKIRNEERNVIKNKIKIIQIKKVDKRKRIRRPKICFFCIQIRKKIENKKLHRIKREVPSYSNIDWKLPLNLINLKKIEEYKQMWNYVDKYISKINKNNEKTLGSLNTPTKFETINEKYQSPNDIISKIMSLLKEYIFKSRKLSFFSPSIFNLFSSCNTEDCMKNNILSPTIFSFHKNDGIFTLPDIIKITSLSNSEVNEWLNILMNLSGASKIINETIVKLEPKMEEMKNIIYPTILEIESHERRKELVNKMLTKEQQADYSSNGYSFLNEKQINILFDKNLFKEENERLTMLARLNKDELESRLEKQILDMVDSDVRKYNKREIQSGKEDNNEFKNGESNEHFTILRPFAFSNNIGDPGFLEASILSPNAFLLELLSPEAVMFNLLNPRAFVASILSPNAIFSRILQPGFFRAEILSPSAINSWVLSPDFFMAEVLSPKIMEARVLSPQYLFTEILSPGLLSPKVYSPDNAGLVVLSPFVLSPLIGSRESMLIQVLSPHILGGDINESHKEESPSDKSKRNDTLISY